MFLIILFFFPMSFRSLRTVVSRSKKKNSNNPSQGPHWQAPWCLNADFSFFTIYFQHFSSSFCLCVLRVFLLFSFLFIIFFIVFLLLHPVSAGTRKPSGTTIYSMGRAHSGSPASSTIVFFLVLVFLFFVFFVFFVFFCYSCSFSFPPSSSSSPSSFSFCLTWHEEAIRHNHGLHRQSTVGRHGNHVGPLEAADQGRHIERCHVARLHILEEVKKSECM